MQTQDFIVVQRNLVDNHFLQAPNWVTVSLTSLLTQAFKLYNGLWF